MGTQDDKRSEILRFTGLLVIGVGVGWLVGLSVSPVVSTVIASLTAIVASVVAVMSGIEPANAQEESSTGNVVQLPKKYADPLPIAVLIVGIICGSAIGITARNYGWFGTDLDLEVHKWTKYGLSDKTVAERLFAAAYQDGGVIPEGQPLGTVLFSEALGSTCSQLAGLEGDALEEQIELIGKMRVEDIVEHREDLMTMMERLCRLD